MSLTAKPTLLSSRQIIALAEKHERSPFGVRDAALIACSGLAYLTLLDLSLLKTADVIHQNGRIYAQTVIPSQYSPSGKQKIMIIPDGSYLHDILQRYIEWRKEKGFGLTNLGVYQELDPDSQFFLTDSGETFKLTARISGAKGISLMQPTKLRRHSQRFVFPEDITLQGLNQSFVLNFYRESVQDGLPVKTLMNLEALTGLGKDTLRRWVRREPRSTEQILSDMYR